jgi:hypothetical protein
VPSPFPAIKQGMRAGQRREHAVGGASGSGPDSESCEACGARDTTLQPAALMRFRNAIGSIPGVGLRSRPGALGVEGCNRACPRAISKYWAT